MKTSNKLILGLGIITLAAILGTNLVLKAEYSKINFDDIFFKYSQESLPSFSVIHIRGKDNGPIHIQPSEKFEIRVVQGEENNVSWEIRGDTLVFSVKSYRQKFFGDILMHPPIAFIMAPSLRAVHLDDVSSKLTGWNDIDLTLKGTNSKILLEDCTLKRLRTNIAGGGLLKIAAANQVQKGNIVVTDTSTLVVEKDIFQSLDIDIGDQAYISLPGTLYSTLRE